MEKELQVVMRDAASLRRDFTRMSLTTNQRTALESSTVFRETELGSFLEDSEEAGIDTALLAQVRSFSHRTRIEGGVGVVILLLAFCRVTVMVSPFPCCVVTICSKCPPIIPGRRYRLSGR